VRYSETRLRRHRVIGYVIDDSRSMIIVRGCDVIMSAGFRSLVSEMSQHSQFPNGNRHIEFDIELNIELNIELEFLCIIRS